MLYFKSQALSTLLIFIGVLHVVLASAPRFHLEKTYDASTGILTTQLPTEVNRDRRKRGGLCNVSGNVVECPVDTSTTATLMTSSTATATTQDISGVSISTEDTLTSSSTTATTALTSGKQSK